MRHHQRNLFEYPDGSVRVRLQDRTNGKIDQYRMPTLLAAWYSLGLNASDPNGIDVWLELALMPGMAGRD